MFLCVMNSVIANFIGVVAFVLYGKFSYEDPMLKLKKLTVVIEDPIVDAHLQRYADAIGADFDAYRGHINRVMTYALHFLDPNVAQGYRKIIGVALVYHDIALWTEGTLAYLEPSQDRAERDLLKEFNPAELALVKDIIYWHHKITPYHGLHADIINAVRKADWIDATQGVVHQGMPRQHIKDCVRQVPYNGFHGILMAFGSKLYGINFLRIVKEISSIYKY